MKDYEGFLWCTSEKILRNCYGILWTVLLLRKLALFPNTNASLQQLDVIFKLEKSRRMFSRVYQLLTELLFTFTISSATDYTDSVKLCSSTERKLSASVFRVALLWPLSVLCQGALFLKSFLSISCQATVDDQMHIEQNSNGKNFLVPSYKPKILSILFVSLDFFPVLG